MTQYPHELTECEECGAHYCMGCAGEECPNCKLQEVAFYAIKLENKLEAVKTWKHGIFLKMPFVGSTGHITKYDLDKLDEILGDGSTKSSDKRMEKVKT